MVVAANQIDFASWGPTGAGLVTEMSQTAARFHLAFYLVYRLVTETKMNGENSNPAAAKQERTSRFRISGGPVVSNRNAVPAFADFNQLPTSYGDPILFAIPRDPRTIFTYWNINWSNAFARKAPVDRQVYLRLKRSDGSDEVEEAVEPMLGTHFLLVAHPKGAYQVEIGFYDPSDTWNSIAMSDSVTMPADTSSENVEIDVATVPFHLSFQRIIDLFRAENGEAIASVLSALQNRADTSADGLSQDEREILSAMYMSLGDLQEARRGFAAGSLDDLIRKRAEAVLGFGGGTSPGGGADNEFGSSWSSGIS
jgi:hypothetical protein